MKRARVNTLDDKYFGTVEEGIKARLEKVTKRGTDNARVQAISNFATNILKTLDNRTNDVPHPATPNTPTTPNTRRHDEEVLKKVDILDEQLSRIVSRVLKHRKETPQIVASVKLPPSEPPSTTNSHSETDNTQIDDIAQELQIMLEDYTKLLGTTKEDLPLQLEKAQRILVTLNIITQIKSDPTALSTTSSSASSSQISKQTTPATTTSTTSTHTSSVQQPTQTSTIVQPTQSQLKQPSKVKKDESTELTENGNAKKVIKSPRAKKASGTTPTKTNGKRKSIGGGITSDDVNPEPSPRRSTRRKTEGVQY
eukprot:Phypoly_transcript_12539.p1 GENE.Phypoly_transcript_12539~~Phypoly_transcript_12539.p1  ORF type:complete len:327 (+),score=69.47 Phypoly_transcript_12539:50-982(+)